MSEVAPIYPPFGSIGTQDDALSQLLTPEYRANPHPLYRRLREEAPVHRSGAAEWVFSRHSDVVSVLRHPGLGRPPQLSLPVEALQILLRMFLLLDPPDHTRQRAVVAPFFTASYIEARRARVTAIVDELLAAVPPSEPIDLIGDYAYPLPVRVISEMLGVPGEDAEQFTRWSRAMVVGLDPEQMEPAHLVGLLEAAQEFVDYVRGLAAQRRRHPRPDDLLTTMVEAVDTEELSEEELISICVLLLIAGHETTVNLVGNGALTLLRHPDQLQRWRDKEVPTRAAVEELLRYEPPISRTARVAHTDVDIGGVTVRQGEMVVALMAAANRDPAVFGDPDGLDLGRSPNPHASFGHGIHFCLGAALARVEGQVALEALVTRFPSLRLDTVEPHWKSSLVLRGLASLAVVTGEPAAASP